METRNGHTLYLVIDYDKPLDEDGDQYETYFLNLVDESDLLALIDEDSAPVCSCANKCEAGAVNTACEVCRANMTECAGKAAEPKRSRRQRRSLILSRKEKRRQRPAGRGAADRAGGRRRAVLVQAP